MSEPERSARNFLLRWTRRKRAVQVGADERATLRKDEPRGVDRLAAVKGDGAEGHSAERGNGGPDQDLQESFHGFSLLRFKVTGCS